LTGPTEPFAVFLQSLSDVDSAAKQWRVVCRDFPDVAHGALVRLLINSDELFREDDNDAVAEKLTIIFDSSRSDNVQLFFDNRLSRIQIELLCQSVSHVFAGIFNRRCDSVASAGRRTKVTNINNLCYMFWDLFPFRPYQCDSRLFESLLCAIAANLFSRNLAVVESGLHGIGHWVRAGGAPVSSSISWLTADDFPEEVREYANMALKGLVE